MLSPIEKSMVIPPDPIWRRSVAQYHEMIDSGILTSDEQAAYQNSSIYRNGGSVPIIIDGREVGRLSIAQLLD